jgi:NADPH:quinone reductase-like Zn-dependent oxidoreductase
MTAHPTTGAAVDLLTKDLSTKDSATMRLWSMDALGRENLRQSTAPIPTPARGEILVKVAAVSLNFRDKLVIESGMGLALTFPFVPASDMAGTVVRAGDDVTRFRVGDRVISTFRPDWIDGPPSGTASVPPYETLGGTHPGVLADYVCFPEAWFSRAPDTLDDAEASTLPCAGLTAWFALVERGSLHPGQTVLVQGTGGVALFGLQIARAHGAEVIVLSGSEEKLARAKALGATHLINRSREDWVQAVYRVTGDRGADHIFELAGGANLGRSVEAVAINGRISVIGVFEGFTFSGPMAPLLLKSPTIQGIGVGHRRALEDLVRAVDRIGLKPVIDHRYGFDELGAALDHLDRGPFGKIVVQMDA